MERKYNIMGKEIQLDVSLSGDIAINKLIHAIDNEDLTAIDKKKKEIIEKINLMSKKIMKISKDIIMYDLAIEKLKNEDYLLVFNDINSKIKDDDLSREVVNYYKNDNVIRIKAHKDKVSDLSLKLIDSKTELRILIKTRVEISDI